MAMRDGPVQSYPGQDDTSGFVNLRAAIPAVDTTLSFPLSVCMINIQLDASSTPMAIQLGAVACPFATSFQIPAGGKFTYQGRPIQAMHINGGSTPSGDYNIEAH